MSGKINNLSFPLILRALRRCRGITQGQLGESLGVTASAINNWEKGKTRAGHAKLIHLAEFFNITLDELLGRVPLGKRARLLTDANLPALRMYLADAIQAAQSFLDHIARLENAAPGRRGISLNKRRSSSRNGGSRVPKSASLMKR